MFTSKPDEPYLRCRVPRRADPSGCPFNRGQQRILGFTHPINNLLHQRISNIGVRRIINQVACLMRIRI